MSWNLETLLRANASVDDYKIYSEQTQSYELFFVHDKLETVRSTDTVETTVTVYVDHDDARGDASFRIYASTTEAEAERKIAEAAQKAGVVKNQPYTLPENETLDGAIASNLAEDTPVALAKQIADAVFAADLYGQGSINALEIFLRKHVVQVKNSRGIDKRETKYSAMVEAIPTWNAEESVELYECQNFNRFDAAKVTAEIERRMREVRDRSLAEIPTEKPKCTVVLDAPEVMVLLGDIVYDLGYATVYAGSNPFSVGDAVQKGPTGDLLTVTMRGAVEGSVESALFDANGTTLVDTEVIRGGKVVDYFGSHRFAQYLGRKATGSLECCDVAAGTLTDAELAEKPYFRCASMSGLQVDVLNDYIGGEVRLAYYCANGESVPMTGISISGKLSDALASMRLASERTAAGGGLVPKYAAFEGIEIV
ncbi:MAG: hypothetical protein IKU55_02135 [Clostridia bacterium]|nr:hypothetical protein [Clostridia bacterium]